MGSVLSLESKAFLGYVYRFLHLFSVLNIIESLHFCYNRVQKEDKSERKEKFLEQVLTAQGIIYNSA